MSLLSKPDTVLTNVWPERISTVYKGDLVIIMLGDLTFLHNF
jgi:hypothetical protein